ncbi:hypothetical protein ACTFIW_005035 [Dictyostelium discoideum]
MKYNQHSFKHSKIELINLQEVLKGRKRNVNKEKVTVKKTKSKPIKNSKSAIKTTTTTATTTTKSQSKNLKTKPKTKSTIENELIKETDDIDYSENHSLEKGYKLNGSAQIIPNKEEGGDMIIQLTPSSTLQVGSIWSRKKVTIDNGFQCEFTFNVSRGGADGFAFILQTNGINEIMLCGGELGYNQMANGVIAIEFDTHCNQGMGDPCSNHISIQGQTPNQSLSTYHQYSLGYYNLIQINDGVDKHVKIIYNSEKKEIEILVDGKIILKGVKIPYTFPKYAYFGFTGATGYEKQIHIIKGCRFNSVLN